MYGKGISREGGLIDMGVEQGFVKKSGAWYTYEGDQLGQGKENARTFLRDNPDLADELEKKIKEKLGIGPRVDARPRPTRRPPRRSTSRSAPVPRRPPDEQAEQAEQARLGPARRPRGGGAGDLPSPAHRGARTRASWRPHCVGATCPPTSPTGS